MNTSAETTAGPGRKVRVAHVVESFEGGVFNSVRQLCHMADPERYEVALVHSIRPKTPPDFRALFEPRIRLEEIAMTRGISPARDLTSLLRLMRALRRLKPDVLHLHSSKAGALGRVAARLLGIPCLYSPRGFPFLMMDNGPAKRKAYYAIERLLAAVSGTIVGCSETEFAYARRLGKARLINNGVDMDLIDSVLAAFPYRPAGKPLVIGTAGRICFQKNPALFARLAERMPEARWIWIGDGELRADLDAEKNRIEITGWKNRRETLEQIAGLDIYVQTSAWEGMPISVLEAMGLGKPVVATRVVGNQDAVVDGETGYLADDADGLLECLGKLGTGGEAALKRMGEAGRARVIANFDAKAKAREWTDLYRASAKFSARR